MLHFNGTAAVPGSAARADGKHGFEGEEESGRGVQASYAWVKATIMSAVGVSGGVEPLSRTCASTISLPLGDREKIFRVFERPGNRARGEIGNLLYLGLLNNIAQFTIVNPFCGDGANKNAYLSPGFRARRFFRPRSRIKREIVEKKAD